MPPDAHFCFVGAGVMQVPEQQSISSSSGSSSSSIGGTSAQLQDIMQQLNDKDTQLQAMSSELRILEEAAAQMADAVSGTAQLAETHSTHMLEPAGVQLQETGSNSKQNTPAGYPAVSMHMPPAAAAADACSAANDCLAISDFKDSSSAAAAGSRWRCVASRRTELLLRWQCLLEEWKQLTLLLQAEQGEWQRCSRRVQGELPALGSG